MEITEKMALALLKKGFEYELEDAELEMEIPISTFTRDFEDETMIKMTFKYAGLKMKISKND